MRHLADKRVTGRKKVGKVCPKSEGRPRELRTSRIKQSRLRGSCHVRGSRRTLGRRVVLITQ